MCDVRPMLNYKKENEHGTGENGGLWLMSWDVEAKEREAEKGVKQERSKRRRNKSEDMENEDEYVLTI